MVDTPPLSHKDGAPHEEPKGWERRDFLRWGAIATTVAVAGGTGALVRHVLQPAPEDPRLLRLRETYRATGRIEDIDILRDLYVAHEIRTLRSHSVDGIGTEDEHQKEVRIFLERVQANFIRDAQRTPPPPEGRETDSLQHLTMLKRSFENAYLPNTVYNEARDSVAFVPRGSLQCRSATRLFIMAARNTLGATFGEREELVEVYTNGHVRPGIVTAERQLYAFEMTQRGATISYVGSLETPPPGIRVIRADDALAHTGLQIPTRDLREPLVDTAARASRPVQPTSGNFREPFAFGNPTTPSGDRPLQTISAAEAQRLQRQAQQVQHLLQNVAPRFPRVRTYLQHLPQANDTLQQLHAAAGDAGRRLEHMSAAELEQILTAMIPIWIQHNNLQRQHNFNRTSLELMAATGSQEAQTEIERAEELSRGITRLESLVTMDARQDRLHAQRQELDPLYGVNYQISNRFLSLRIFAASRHPSMLPRIMALERNRN